MLWTPDVLRPLLAAGEGRQLEFKRGLQHDAKIARTLCAFANTRGGVLLIGVSDSGAVLGAPRPAQTLAHLQALARDALLPPLAADFALATLDALPIVVCAVPLSPARPHVPRDAVDELVVRVGSSNRVARGAASAALRAFRPRARALTALDRDALRWLVERSTHDVAELAHTLGIGVQRTRRILDALERDGFVSGVGPAGAKIYRLVHD